MEVCVEPLSKADIRKIVKKIRKLAGCEGKVRFPIIRFIEWILGDPESGYNYEIIPEHEMKDMYGNTDANTNTIRIREDVYIGAISGNARDMFTLFHELGHCILHSKERVSFARGKIPAYMNPEWQANTFAAEMMAPFDVAKSMSVDELVKTFGMSLQAASIRYDECHK